MVIVLTIFSQLLSVECCLAYFYQPYGINYSIPANQITNLLVITCRISSSASSI